MDKSSIGMVGMVPTQRATEVLAEKLESCLSITSRIEEMTYAIKAIKSKLYGPEPQTEASGRPSQCMDDQISNLRERLSMVTNDLEAVNSRIA